MYNLFMGYIGPNETENEIAVSASRFLEYTDSETQMRYRNLNSDAVREIKEYPCLFRKDVGVASKLLSDKAIGGISGRVLIY